MSARMTVIQTEHLAAPAAKWLAERAELVVGDAESAAFAAAAPRAVALVVRTYTQVNDALLARLPALRQLGALGLDWTTLTKLRALAAAFVCSTRRMPTPRPWLSMSRV